MYSWLEQKLDDGRASWTSKGSRNLVIRGMVSWVWPARGAGLDGGWGGVSVSLGTHLKGNTLGFKGKGVRGRSIGLGNFRGERQTQRKKIKKIFTTDHNLPSNPQVTH